MPSPLILSQTGSSVFIVLCTALYKLRRITIKRIGIYLAAPGSRAQAPPCLGPGGGCCVPGLPTETRVLQQQQQATPRKSRAVFTPRDLVRETHSPQMPPHSLHRKEACPAQRDGFCAANTFSAQKSRTFPAHGFSQRSRASRAQGPFHSCRAGRKPLTSFILGILGSRASGREALGGAVMSPEAWATLGRCLSPLVQSFPVPPVLGGGCGAWPQRHLAYFSEQGILGCTRTPFTQVCAKMPLVLPGLHFPSMWELPCPGGVEGLPPSGSSRCHHCHPASSSVASLVLLSAGEGWHPALVRISGLWGAPACPPGPWGSPAEDLPAGPARPTA
ncbi:uncharacterized protein LOC121932677 [Sceloporus undulatus]|uniref:uncharacterized protein LOC121932677 n=1 Tax=Sceloporus undulatus TaxID=8520 RepID=UPI001C4ACE2B|nr:uncharacterized protein LOC121932677 [Sceloporus undulatus]